MGARSKARKRALDVLYESAQRDADPMATLRERLAQKAPNSGGTLEANEYALQMLRFPYRQVFGDPTNEEGQSTFELDAFQVSVALPAWRAKVVAGLAGGTP